MNQAVARKGVEALVEARCFHLDTATTPMDSGHADGSGSGLR